MIAMKLLSRIRARKVVGLLLMRPPPLRRSQNRWLTFEAASSCSLQMARRTAPSPPARPSVVSKTGWLAVSPGCRMSNR